MTDLSIKTTPTNQAPSPKGPMYIKDFLATGAALNGVYFEWLKRYIFVSSKIFQFGS